MPSANPANDLNAINDDLNLLNYSYRDNANAAIPSLGNGDGR
jgi:hypothetical protein